MVRENLQKYVKIQIFLEIDKCIINVLLKCYFSNLPPYTGDKIKQCKFKHITHKFS